MHFKYLESDLCFIAGYKKLIKANVGQFVMFEDGISVSLVLAVKHYDRSIEFTRRTYFIAKQ